GGSVSKAILDRPSNEAPGQNGLCPKGCGAFGLWLRCSSGHRALRLCSGARAEAPRASPQAKIAGNKLCSIPRSGEYAPVLGAGRDYRKTLTFPSASMEMSLAPL